MPTNSNTQSPGTDSALRTTRAYSAGPCTPRDCTHTWSTRNAPSGTTPVTAWSRFHRTLQSLPENVILTLRALRARDGSTIACAPSAAPLVFATLAFALLATEG